MGQCITTRFNYDKSIVIVECTAALRQYPAEDCADPQLMAFVKFIQEMDAESNTNHWRGEWISGGLPGGTRAWNKNGPDELKVIL